MAIKTFTGGGIAGNWSDPANWKSASAPGITDTALVLGGPDGAVNGAVAVNSIMLIGGETLSFTGAVTAVGVGNCQGFMVCIYSTAIFAPGSSLNDGGVLQIGVAGTGTFIARSSATAATTIQSKSGVIGKLAAGIGTATIDGATWHTDASLLVGDSGSGTLNVINAGHVSVGGDYVMGLNSGATGHATLASGGVLSVAENAAIGGIRGGAPIGTGTLTVDAGATFDVQKSVRVASGSAIVLAGGTVSAGDEMGGIAVLPGGDISGTGTLTTRAGATLADSGTIEATGGVLQINARVSGLGAIVIDDNSTIALTGSSLLLPTVTFNGTDATLSLTHGAAVAAILGGFTIGDQITMAGIDAAVWSETTHTLKLTSAGHFVDALHLGGSFASDVFSVAQSNGVGVVTLHVAT